MSTLPIIAPMLARPCAKPFDGSEWLFEIKHDGFRALAYLGSGRCRALEDSLAQALGGRSAIFDAMLDGNGHHTVPDDLVSK